MADAIVAVKTCKKCGAQFVGRSCKPCKKAVDNAWRSANADRLKASMAAYQVAHRKEIYAKHALWFRANQEKARGYRLAWYYSNKDKASESGASYRERNRQKEKLRHELYAKNNAKAVREKNAAWAAENRNLRIIYQQNRRALQRKNGGKLSKDLVSKLFDLQRGKCACCSKALGDDYHLDHRVPIARGGRHEDSNMQLLTSNCNLRKQAKDPIQFMQERGFLF